MKILVVARYTTDRRSATVCHELNKIDGVELFNLTWGDHEDHHPLRNMFRTGLDSFDFPQYSCHFDRPNRPDVKAYEMCLEMWKPDIVVLANEVYEEDALANINLAKKYGAKTALIAWQNTLHPPKEEKLLPYIQRVCAVADIVLCGATYTVEWHKRFGKGNFVFAPFLAVKEGLFYPIKKEDFVYEKAKMIRDKFEGKFVINYIGRFLEWKIGSIPKAIDKLLSKHKDMAFFAVGEGFSDDSDDGKITKELYKVVEKYKDRALILPYAKDAQELNEYFSASDMNLYPSIPKYGRIIEQVGVMHTDASLCGVPSITSKIGGGPDHVIDKETGYTIDTEDPNNIVKAVEHYKKLNPSDKWKMQNKAIQYCQRWLGSNVAKWIYKELRGVIDENRFKRND